MSIEANRALVRRVAEAVWNGDQLDLLAEVMPPDLVNHVPDGRVVDRAGLARLVRDLRAAFPDSHLVLADLLAEGDRVALRWIWYGRHTGSPLAAPPSGRAAQLEGLCICRVARDVIVEIWWAYDTGVLMRQLGMIVDAEHVPA